MSTPFDMLCWRLGPAGEGCTKTKGHDGEHAAGFAGPAWPNERRQGMTIEYSLNALAAELRTEFPEWTLGLPGQVARVVVESLWFRDQLDEAKAVAISGVLDRVADEIVRRRSERIIPDTPTWAAISDCGLLAVRDVAVNRDIKRRIRDGLNREEPSLPS